MTAQSKNRSFWKNLRDRLGVPPKSVSEKGFNQDSLWEKHSFPELIGREFHNLAPLIKRIIRCMIIVAFIAAALNYSSSHARQFLCQWGIGEKKHCEHRPSDWHRSLFP